MEIEIASKAVLLDDCDASLLADCKWSISTVRTKHRTYEYVASYQKVNRRSVIVFLHRLIAGAPPGTVVDHINGNPLDNRREKLRVCTHAENMRNRAPSAVNKSGFKGVYWDATRRKWVAQIRAAGRRHSLGRFDTASLAHDAYVAAAHDLHGAFARAA